MDFFLEHQVLLAKALYLLFQLKQVNAFSLNKLRIELAAELMKKKGEQARKSF